jgi:hypothetical protein
VREPSEWSGGPSDMEGKTTRVGASECGQRTSFNRTREAGHLDEIQGVVASTPNLFRNGAVGFIVWLDGFVLMTLWRASLRTLRILSNGQRPVKDVVSYLVKWTRNSVPEIS